MPNSTKKDAVFELVKAMSKAEKRNFKLYATRLSGNHDAKFLALFDCMESLSEYDEGKILARCSVSKIQLPNMKAHLHRQILSSIRMLGIRHDDTMRVREMLDFAQILFDKGLYRQCSKHIEKLEQMVSSLESYGSGIDLIWLQNRLDVLNVSKDMTTSSDAAHRRTARICTQIENNSELSTIATRLYSLYHKLGYARTQKDLDLIRQYFRPRLDAYACRLPGMSFRERFYYYESMAWYYYIQHNFALSYRYSRKWVELFDAYPRMKRVMYDDYMNGCSQILEGLYLMQRYRRFVENLDYLSAELDKVGTLNTNAHIISRRIIYTNRIHKCFIQGKFTEGTALTGEVESFLERYSEHLDIHFRMLTYYKLACLYFGDGDYRRCMGYLSLVISTKDPQIRRDLQCFARILNLIAAYEAGMDQNLDYQIRSVYKFLVRMNDMNLVQREILAFLKRLGTIYADDLRTEFKVLYDRLKPYEHSTYERRAFYYLDILSWLESKITGKTMGDIIRRKFKESYK